MTTTYTRHPNVWVHYTGVALVATVLLTTYFVRPGDSQGQTGLRVVDSLGQQVGVPVGDGTETIVFIDGRWVETSVDTGGFVPRTGTSVSFTSFDCSGVPQLLSAEILRDGFTFDGQILQYVDPVMTQTFNSHGTLNADGTISGCFQFPQTYSGGPLVPFDLATLGLTPPFMIVQ